MPLLSEFGVLELLDVRLLPPESETCFCRLTDPSSGGDVSGVVVNRESVGPFPSSLSDVSADIPVAKFDRRFGDDVGPRQNWLRRPQTNVPADTHVKERHVLFVAFFA